MKRITKRMLAVLLTLVMVIGFMPGNLSVPVSAEDNTVYVATTGNDETGDGTQANPYASIGAALTAITDDTVETTILVADGAYNVLSADGKANLHITKDNVTIKAQNKGQATLYSYATKTSVSTGQKECATVSVSADNVTLDGLTIVPALNNASISTRFVTAVPASDFPFLPAGVSGDVYMAAMGNAGNQGVVSVAGNGGFTASNLTVQNCTIGYSGIDDTNKTSLAHTICLAETSSAGIKGEYHILNNTIYGQVYIAQGTTSVTGNEIIGNDFYVGNIYVSAMVDANTLPRLRGNTLHSAYQTNSKGVTLLNYTQWGDANVEKRYTDGEVSVIAKTNTCEIDGYEYLFQVARKGSDMDATNGYAYFSSTYPGISFATTSTLTSNSVDYTSASLDETMDSEEELGYYLGEEGTVTLTQNFTITKAGVLPEKILATVDFGTYTISKTEGLELPAPAGYHWNENVLEKDQWVASALVLQNDLNMKFYVFDEYLQDGYYLAVTMGNETVNLGDWKDGTGDNAGKKYVTFSGIMATEMTEDITIQLYKATGEAVDGCNFTDSIRDNADRLKAAYSDNTNLMALVEAVLNYGAAAQTYAGESDATKLANYGWQ